MIHRGITFYKSHTYVIENGKPVKLEIPDDADFGGFFKNQLLVRLKSDWTNGAETYPQGALVSGPTSPRSPTPATCSSFTC